MKAPGAGAALVVGPLKPAADTEAVLLQAAVDATARVRRTVSSSGGVRKVSELQPGVCTLFWTTPAAGAKQLPPAALGRSAEA